MASKIVQRCRHCQNMTAFTIAAAGSQPNLISVQERETTTWTTWRVLLCSSCAQPTVERDIQIIDGPIGTTPPPRNGTAEIVYPIERSVRWHQMIPAPVEEMYQEMLNVKKVSPRACAIMAGLTLEALCKAEQAQGSTLAECLNDLARSERIPKTLAEMAQHLRHVRNIGAHAMEEKVAEEDVPILLYFVEAILEYVYVAPATIEAIQASLKHT